MSSTVYNGFIFCFSKILVLGIPVKGYSRNKGGEHKSQVSYDFNMNTKIGKIFGLCVNFHLVKSIDNDSGHLNNDKVLV